MDHENAQVVAQADTVLLLKLLALLGIYNNRTTGHSGLWPIEDPGADETKAVSYDRFSLRMK